LQRRGRGGGGEGIQRSSLDQAEDELTDPHSPIHFIMTTLPRWHRAWAAVLAAADDRHAPAERVVALHQAIRRSADDIRAALRGARRPRLRGLLAKDGFGDAELQRLVCGARRQAPPAGALVDWIEGLSWPACSDDARESSLVRATLHLWIASRELWNDLIAHLLPVARRQAGRWFPRADRELLDDCLTDAILRLETHFNSRRGSVMGFLKTHTAGLLANRERAEWRRRKHEKPTSPEEFEHAFRLAEFKSAGQTIQRSASRMRHTRLPWQRSCATCRSESAWRFFSLPNNAPWRIGSNCWDGRVR
jgi:hypothetical protein